MILAGCVTAMALAACGGGGGGSASTGTPTPAPTGGTPTTDPTTPANPTSPANPTAPTTNPDPLTPPPGVPDTTPIGGAGAPLATGNIALDGREWLNYRRSQVGMSTLVQSSFIDRAAQNHSDYQRLNNTITHDEVSNKAGFTGVDVAARLTAAGYVFNTRASRAYGEVISATNNGSGQYMAEELITAVYHRFVIFEPVFKEIGTGAATTGQGYNYFTANFTANNGYGAGLASGQVAVWPFNGQTVVPRNFFSDTESPDPVPDRNEVGYPISVHANIDLTIRVTSFTVRRRGGADLAVRLLTNANDAHTGTSSAAIVPLAPLAANAIYDVSFAGTVGSTPVTRTWSFTTR
jgi:uncharacterized protein YkwD